ncbi:molybdopterin oxidoreductase (plasmid) [Haloterrigena turkmenica DSM 5511]|uniref:Molybdopterin oxidoreductase n=2 Tax=Haloterrigena turkmenica TaxID=62320 RepID=D2S0P7_HALTV|nr:molybdopterin oxidoreductase [Haloterrigena turkmenica DSM 5511]
MTTNDDDLDHSTVCPLCAVGCRLGVGDRSRANGVSGPMNPNGRLCRKGINALDVDTEDRLTQPLLRDRGELRPASWGEAYERIVDGIEATLDRHGPNAMGFFGAPHCTNEENYLLQKLARMLGTNNIDNRARLCHESTTRCLETRVGWPASTNGLAELSDADVIIIAGANPAKRQPIAFNSFVRPAVNNGATLVHIDPIGNATTRLAEIHITPRPETDALVFDLLSTQLLDGNDIDREFIHERTRQFEPFAASIRGLNPTEAMSAAGVDETQIDRLAELVATADGVAALVGTGIEGDNTNAPEALLNLLLLTGNIGRPGAGLYVLRGLANEQGATDTGCVPDRLPGHQSVTATDARERIAKEWGMIPPSNHGKNAREMLTACGKEIRAAVVVGENPAISKCDPDWTCERLDTLDHLVVLDLFLSETASNADVVLPAAAGFEKRGTITNLERRVQRFSPMTHPPSSARSDFEILRDLGTLLLPDSNAFEYQTVADVFDELTRIAPTYEGLSFAELGLSGRQWPVNSDSTLYRDSFETSDGRAVFSNDQSRFTFDSASGLSLIAGGRVGETQGDDSEAKRRLRMHPEDAQDRNIGDQDLVVISNEEQTIKARVELDEKVRCTTVYLPARVADPLLRRGTSAIIVTSATKRNQN